MFTRYAVYLTPPPGPLASFGAGWLGWDLERGQTVAHPPVAGVDVAALTQTPRKYGFHGTIKPPFRLAQGTDADALAAAVAQFCAAQSAVVLEGLHLAALGRFLALVPVGDQSALASLAGAAVQQLDPFRAPAPPEEIARRRTAGLTDRQEAHLLRWGYPYVFDCFRFHMTLTGALEPAALEQAQTAVAPLVTPLLPRPFVVDSLSLCGEAEDGRFHLIHRYALTG